MPNELSSPGSSGASATGGGAPKLDQMYRVAFDSNPLPMWMCDMDTLRFLDVNSAACRQYGYTRSEFLGMSVLEIWPPQFAPGVSDTAKALKTHGEAWFSSIHRKRDGTDIHVEITANPVEIGGVRACVVVARDVSQQVQTERKLREEISLSESLFNCAPGGLFVMDATGEILRWNGNFEAGGGYTPEEITASRGLSMIEPEDRPAAAASIQKAFATGRAQVEARFIQKNGHRVSYLFHGSRVEYQGRTCLICMGLDLTAQKQADAAIRRSEALRAQMMEVALDPMFLIDDTGLIRETNPAAEQTFECGRAELVGRCFREFLPAGSADFCIGGSQRLNQRFEGRARRGHGKEFPAEFSLSGFDTDEAPMRVLSVRDISAAVESKQALERSQAELHRREELYRLLLESTHAVPWEADGLSTRVTYVGPQIVPLLEHPLEKWYEPGFWESTLHPEDRDRVLQQCRRERRKEESYEIEYRMQARSGRVVWVLDIVTVEHADGKPSRMRGSLIDITTRKLDEMRVRENEERFRQLTENCHQAIWLQDLGSQQLLYVNPSFERILGHNRESISSDPQAWLRIVHPEDLDRARAMVERARGGADCEIECRIVKPDGTIRWVRSRSVPVRDANGQIYRQMGMAEDITEVRALEAQLLQAQKMEAIGTMAGGIAHDFNNILGAILGFAELARMDTADPQLHSYLGEILKASHRAKDLVRQILAFSRKQEQNRTVVDLKQAVAEVAKLLRATTPSTIDVRAALDPQTPPVPADATQMQQVLMNLAVNGVHAMDRGPGVLEIGLQPVNLQNEAMARQLELSPGIYAQLTVRDTGCGIPPENLSRIFDPFFTTKAPGSGTGLGLSVVHGIVRSHGGAIAVESWPGRGSLFRVYLPVAQTSGEAPAAEPGGYLPGQGQRILFVDDEAPIVRVMSRVLSTAGYKTETFTSGGEAARAFSRDPDRFDLVISDLTMPGCDGVEFGTLVRKLRPHTPVILVSGYVPPQEAERIAGLGAVLLNKPLDRASLLRKIGQVLAKR